MIVLLPDHSGFALDQLICFNQHSADANRVLYDLRGERSGDLPRKMAAKCSGAAFSAAVERALMWGQVADSGEVAP